MINIYRHFTNETWKVCSWLKDEESREPECLQVP